MRGLCGCVIAPVRFLVPPKSVSLPFKFRATLMFKCEESGAGTLGIAADAPVQRGRADQGVVPLAATGAVARYLRRSGSRQSLALPIRLIIARLSLADMPQLLVC